MLEVERNSPIEAAALAEFFARCGWQEVDAVSKMEWALAASEEWVVCKLDGQVIGFGRSCRLDAVKRVVFDVLVDPRFKDSGLGGEIVRLLTENAGSLEEVSVFSDRPASFPSVPPVPQDDVEPGQSPPPAPDVYLGRGAAGSGGRE